MKNLITFLALIIIYGSQAQCLGTINEFSTFPINPERDINGIFSFDYHIVSSIEISARYKDNTDTWVPKVKRYAVDFYINSADGSAYFPDGFFIANFGSASRRGRVMHGTIWMSDGHMVSYVDDKGQYRAIVVKTDQTKSDVELGNMAFYNRFVEGIRTATSTPAPIPVDMPWGDTEGFVSEITQADGSTGKITLYYALNPGIPPIKTSVPLVGFLVGVVKDFAFHNCNRLAVFSKMEIVGTTDYIQAELFSITPEEISFDGKDFKIMAVGGGDVNRIASMSQEEQENMVALQQDYNARIMALIAEIEDCGSNDTCASEKTRQMQALVKEKQDVMYDLMSDSGRSEGAGSDFLNDQRAIRDEMFVLAGQMTTKELECKRLAAIASRSALERCSAEYEAMKNEMDSLECKMAKLSGIGDMLKDCE